MTNFLEDRRLVKILQIALSTSRQIIILYNAISLHFVIQSKNKFGHPSDSPAIGIPNVIRLEFGCLLIAGLQITNVTSGHCSVNQRSSRKSRRKSLPENPSEELPIFEIQIRICGITQNGKNLRIK